MRTLRLSNVCRPCTRMKVRGNGNTFAGDSNEFIGDDLCITGDRNRVTGKHCIVVGDQNHVRGNHATVNGDGCVVIGDWCNVTGDRCIVIGKNCVVNGNSCHVEGENNQVIGDSTLVDPSVPPSAAAVVDTETDNDELRCVVCMVNRRCFRNSPCGHMVTCSVCTARLWESAGSGVMHCPICRAAVYKTDHVSW